MAKYLDFNLVSFSTNQQTYLDKEKAKIRLKGVKVLCFVLWLYLPVMTPWQFNNIETRFGTQTLYFYISYILFTLLVSIILWYYIKIHRVKDEKLVKYANRLFLILVLLQCQVNIVTNLVSVYFGSDLLGIIFSPSIFATSFLLSRKYRVILLASYFVIIETALISIFNFSLFGLIDKTLSLTAACIIFYIVGDFILYYWYYEKKRLIENIKNTNELEQKNKQQKETFDALTQAFRSFTRDNSFASFSKINPKASIEQQTEQLIQEFKTTQQLFKVTLKKYEDIFENVNDGILILDEKGFIKDINSAGREILEISLEDFSKITLASLVFDDDKIRSKFYINQLITEGQYKGYEGRVRTPKGNEKYLEVSSTAIYSASGDFLGSRDIIRDISERKKAEVEIEKARNAEKQFLANMSHEIRTPLNAIIGMSHLLFDTNPNEDQIEYLNIIRNSSNFLLSLISDILDMSKIEAGKMEINLAQFDLIGLLNTVSKTFNFKLEKTPVAFSATIDPNLKGFWLGDELILSQILYNILSNADKFTDQGQIKLVAKEISQNGDIRLIKFSVSDTGIGMEKEKLSIIFDKFTQVHEKNMQKQKGTGLGLALCKEFVEMLKGQISAVSTPNKGTIISFILPIQKISDNLPAKNELNEIKDLVNIKNKSVLVAEDNKLNRVFVQKILEKIGVDFDFAFDGKDVVEKAQIKKYNLILMDLEMPKLTGMEATIAIRNTFNLNQNTPIIALTASAMSSIKSEALNVGMNGFMSKPFTPKQLETVLFNELS